LAKEKKEKKKETSAVKQNTSGHYRRRRYNYLTFGYFTYAIYWQFMPVF